jgi:hypothetical protein
VLLLEKLLVVGSLALALGVALLLQRDAFAFALQHTRRDETLDFRRARARLAALLFWRDGAAHDKLAHVGVGVERKQLADLRGALRAQTDRHWLIGQAGQLLLALCCARARARF